ncbi:MAG TPA: hypothetical protein VI409_08375 [Gaiellaceae bacterium]|nr:hypothetical protein [Gaiellaceae bacterium]
MVGPYGRGRRDRDDRRLAPAPVRAGGVRARRRARKLHWIETSNHVELNDQAPFVPEAVAKLVEWFGTHMQAEMIQER